MVDFSRTRLLIGDGGVEKLSRSRILCLGLGGVGGAAVEMLARMGVGHLTLVDGDVFSESNINRQLGALDSTVGRSKAQVWQQRCQDINAAGDFKAVPDFIRSQQDIDALLAAPFDVVIDAIDELKPKIDFLVSCRERDIFVISSMGAGGRRDISQIRVADISKTFGCPLAKAVRSGLRSRGINKGIPAVFTPEESVPRQPGQPVGSISYIVAAFGLYLAQTAVDHLLEQQF
jgi:tRNA A37 threonylcarbamoyladenosine dehydratase